MKNAHIITTAELLTMTGAILAKYNVELEAADLRADVIGSLGADLFDDEPIVLVHGAVGVAEPTKGVSVSIDVNEPEKFDDDPENEVDWEANVQEGIDEGARVALEKEPHTIGQLAVALGVSALAARTAISNLSAVKVAPTREDGRTVSKYMIPGTEAYDAFVAEETVRVSDQAERWAPHILSYAPKFYEAQASRPDIVDRACEGLALETDREDLRRDSRAIFYLMAEVKQLHHRGHGWRAFKTPEDEKNVQMMQGTIREVLMGNPEGLSWTDLNEKLPAQVEEGPLVHAVAGMDDVYEQDQVLVVSAEDGEPDEDSDLQDA